MRYYVRRSFNRDLLPKTVPKDVPRTKSVGSPFNIWVREKTKSIEGMTNKRFALICKVPYPSYMGWRFSCDPHLWGQCRLAEGLEKCGVGEYDELLAEIKKLVRS